MSKGYITEPIQFIVKDKTENHPITYDGKLQYEDCLWFQKSEGEKKGLQYIIPITCSEYSDILEKKLANLTEYDTVILKLKSMNEDNTVWIVEELISIDS